MFSTFRTSAALSVPLFLVGLATGQPLTPSATVNLGEDIAQSDQLSGIALHDGFLLVCPDEGSELTVLKGVSDGEYEPVSSVKLADDDVEIDMEGAASDGEHIFVVGSHSIRRKEVEPERTYKKNRERLTDTSRHEGSYSLFRFKLDDDGKLKLLKEISLAEVIEGDEILGAFSSIPSKENGIDIEGIAVKDGRLYLGFRGPVLRQAYVPVLSFAFDEPEDYELSFVNLAGRGIRDVAAVPDGFLLLAGPVGDGDPTYELYFWNGKDCIPGAGSPGGSVQKLGQLIPKASDKPEGIAITGESQSEWRLLLICDGTNAAARYTVRKP